MKELILEEPGVLTWQQRAIPKPQSREVLVKVHRVGICGSDIHAFHGNQPFFSYPRVLGHELAVEVVEATEKFAKGDLCTVEAYYPCGECPACKNDRPNCCTSLQVLGIHTDGGHCEYMLVPEERLHKGNNLSVDELALVEPLVIGAHAAERGSLREGESVLILGAGTIGIATALFARAEGADVVIADINQEKLNFVRDEMGFEKIALVNDDLEAELRKFFNGQMPYVIYDATGNPKSMMSTFEIIEQSGRIVFVGLFKGDLSFNDPLFHKKELTLLASRAGTAKTFEKVIAMMQNGKVNALPMINQRIKFNDADQAFKELTENKNLVKAMIEF